MEALLEAHPRAEEQAAGLWRAIEDRAAQLARHRRRGGGVPTQARPAPPPSCAGSPLPVAPPTASPHLLRTLCG